MEAIANETRWYHAPTKEEQKRLKLAETMAMRERLKVGDVLYYSWGWEQTNIDYFQVVSKSVASVVLREIAKRIDADGPMAMSGKAYPCPGEFVGEPFRKLVQAGGCRMDHGTAQPVDREYYDCSWYA